ncbi:MAG: efflux RND transporter periplasmic adaptor subunit [Chromatiales bacterium]|jgi:RND family efflux transporter MFP subunit
MKHKTWLSLFAFLILVAVIGWQLFQRLHEEAGGAKLQNAKARPVPVEVAPVELGAIELRRTFSGTLQAYSEFVVSPKVSGRIEQIAVDLADIVTRSQVVAKLDNDEYVQAVRQAEADLAVARANLAEAQSLLKIAERELERVDKLRLKGVSSESQRDAAKADQLAKQAHVEVTRAQVVRAKAELETARIRLSYTEVTAGWGRGNHQRVVAERYVDEGETVGANAQLLRIVELDPIKVVFFVTERDYALLQPGQPADLTTDAYPGETFPAEIVRISPVFRENTRQAQVELKVNNAELRLKPGMFVRVDVVLQRAESVTIVPEQALVKRDGLDGVFMVDVSAESVNWRPVTIGIRQSQQVEIAGEGIEGRVVVLGQQLLDDGSAIAIAGEEKADKP